MTVTNFLNSLGGLALFLLAMAMMTEGLKTYAGHQLKRLLEKFTSTPVRGVIAGFVVTALVQHSGAVTVAAIGFVNAGLMSFRQALSVVFGTNIGTTMSAWLVSFAGVDSNLQAFAMPLLAVGIAVRFGVANKRWQGLGQALAGFGLFFMGLQILEAAFAGLAQQTSVKLGHETAWPVFLAAGLVVTIFTQSSSATLALVITAAAGGLLTLEAGAAAVVGANLGSTSTAVFASLKATPNAKRLATGHVFFNAFTGLVALALFPVILAGVDALAGRLHFGGDIGSELALFHTLFNCLGVVLVLPFSGVLARWLEGQFRSFEEDLAKPQHLDRTLTDLPSLAVSALRQELSRQRSLVAESVVSGLKGNVPSARLEAHIMLHQAIESFIERVSTSTMSAQEAQDLAIELRTARYLDEAVRVAGTALPIAAPALGYPGVERLISSAFDCMALFQESQQGRKRGKLLLEAHEMFEANYQQAKRDLLYDAVQGKRPVSETDALLDQFSALRRLVDQMVKADMALGNVANALAQ